MFLLKLMFLENNLVYVRLIYNHKTYLLFDRKN